MQSWSRVTPEFWLQSYTMLLKSGSCCLGTLGNEFLHQTNPLLSPYYITASYLHQAQPKYTISNLLYHMFQKGPRWFTISGTWQHVQKRQSSQDCFIISPACSYLSMHRPLSSIHLLCQGECRSASLPLPSTSCSKNDWLSWQQIHLISIQIISFWIQQGHPCQKHNPKIQSRKLALLTNKAVFQASNL